MNSLMTVHVILSPPNVGFPFFANHGGRIYFQWIQQSSKSMTNSGQPNEHGLKMANNAKKQEENNWKKQVG